jgi:hypothetical protein
VKHLILFEKWKNALSNSSKMRNLDNVFGIFDNELPNTRDVEDDKKQYMEDLLEVKVILDDCKIESNIEVLDEDTKGEVGQYHILVFEYENDKLYSKGEMYKYDQELVLYTYGHSTLVDYEIIFPNGFRTTVDEVPNKYQEFHNMVTSPIDNNSFADI